MKRGRAFFVVPEDEVGRLAHVAGGDVARELLVPAQVDGVSLVLDPAMRKTRRVPCLVLPRPRRAVRRQSNAPRRGVRLRPGDEDLAALGTRERGLVVDLALCAVAAVKDAVGSCSRRSWVSVTPATLGDHRAGREDALLAETVDAAARSASAEVRNDEEANMVRRRQGGSSG